MVAEGLDASNPPAAKELGKPGEAVVAGGGGNSEVGVDRGANEPGGGGLGMYYTVRSRYHDMI